MTPAARIALRVALTAVLGALAWLGLAWLSSAPLGAAYGWSGHPPIPAAPTWVYVTLFLVVLPVVSLAAAWLVARRVFR